MASSLLKYSLFDHGLPELTAASEKICLLHDYLEGTGEAWKWFFFNLCSTEQKSIYNEFVSDTLHLAELFVLLH